MHREFAPVARSKARRADPTAVQVNQILDKSQAEAQAALRLAKCRFCLGKWLKDPFQDMLGDPPVRILDPQNYFACRHAFQVNEGASSDHANTASLTCPRTPILLKSMLISRGHVGHSRLLLR
jgi:hypothetical protein